MKIKKLKYISSKIRLTKSCLKKPPIRLELSQFSKDNYMTKRKITQRTNFTKIDFYKVESIFLKSFRA